MNVIIPKTALRRWGAGILAGCAFTWLPALAVTPNVSDQDGVIRIQTAEYAMTIQKNGFRYGFQRADGSLIAPAHASSGLLFDQAEATSTRLLATASNVVTLVVSNTRGEAAEVRITASEHHLCLGVKSATAGDVVARTGGITPAFGLGDTGGRSHETTDLTGYQNEQLHSDGLVGGRLISNFVIFPQVGLAEVNVDPLVKIVRLTPTENAQGSHQVKELPAMYYFFGAPPVIYQDFLAVRNQLGYPVMLPKYEWFGVGWEAFGALSYNTSQKTVTENLDHYLALGYPLSWMVLGSGFWPHTNDNYQATTSFGFWDQELYPQPQELIDNYHRRGLKVILGLRIAFITEGPFAAEGVQRGYFLSENSRPKVFHLAFPHRPAYLLDAQQPAAVQWYLRLCQKWLAYGIDGFKEDLFGYEKYVLRDDKLNPVNEALMRQGVYVMGRNGYLGSAMDLQRYDDFNFNQNQDRGPINGLALAYSGWPNVYPDIVGGKFVPEIVPQLKRTNGLADPALQRYFMRNAQYASVNPAMSVGFGPWNFPSTEVQQVVLAAVRLHARLQPYIYSAAVDAAQTGFPYPLTPLPVAYPTDTNVYQLENQLRRGYEWLLGPSLLATPLYGNDCRTASTRDVYLPAGTWMDYDTGVTYQGPATLTQFPLPVGKTPLFIGGAGVLVVRQWEPEQLQAQVYPVAAAPVSYIFTYKDGIQKSVITNPGQTWRAAKVTVEDQTINQSVPCSRLPVTGAVTFRLVPGHNYRVVE